MPHPTLPKLRYILAVILIAVFALAASAQKKSEYFTEDELDLIRDAQDIKERVPEYIELAERRLIILGLTDKSEKQQEKERKEQEQYEKQKKKAGPKGAPVKPP